LLRWKYFVQAEDKEFTATMDAFAKATGVKISLIRESIRARPDNWPQPGLWAEYRRTCLGLKAGSLFAAT
jgi:hypothetical protein